MQPSQAPMTAESPAALAAVREAASRLDHLTALLPARTHEMGGLTIRHHHRVLWHVVQIEQRLIQYRYRNGPPPLGEPKR
jgi:hypothetical protein